MPLGVGPTHRGSVRTSWGEREGKARTHRGACGARGRAKARVDSAVRRFCGRLKDEEMAGVGGLTLGRTGGRGGPEERGAKEKNWGVHP